MGFFSRNKFVDRIEERQSTFGFVEIRSESGTPLAQATLRDRSSYGAMIRSSTHRAIPDRVNLWFPTEQIDVSASVRWTDGGDFGVQFDHAVECWVTDADRKNRLDVVATHLARAGV